jgi:hypothetical protein
MAQPTRSSKTDQTSKYVFDMNSILRASQPNLMLQHKMLCHTSLWSILFCRPKACMGMLYMSQFRYDRERSPVCMGFARRLKGAEQPTASLPTDSIPGGDFKYICVGYSAWDDETLRQAARRRTSPADPIRLPYCEGLEVVSSTAMTSNPELLPNGPGIGSSQGAGASSQHEDADVRPRRGRSFGEWNVIVLSL